MPSTLMSLTGPGWEVFNDYSTRALSMSLKPIGAAAQLARTINGDLLDLSLDQFHDKYEASITCTDHESPSFVGLRPGAEVVLTCIPHLGDRPDESTDGVLVLTMRVVSWDVTRSEWDASTSWTMNLTQ